MCHFNYPFPPAEVVEFFRTYFGPTQRAFAALDADAWCEWDADLWFEEGQLSLQVACLRILLSPKQWTPLTKDAAPPLALAELPVTALLIRMRALGKGERSELPTPPPNEAVLPDTVLLVRIRVPL